MNNGDVYACLHEPFGDPYYYGPERIKFEKNDDIATKRGVSIKTWREVIDGIMEKNDEVCYPPYSLDY